MSTHRNILMALLYPLRLELSLNIIFLMANTYLHLIIEASNETEPHGTCCQFHVVVKDYGKKLYQ